MAFSLGITDKKYITALGIDKRDWLTTRLDISNDEYLTDIMEISGRYKLAINPLYSEFVDDALFKLLDTTGSTVVGTGTPQVTTTLTAGTSGFVRPTDLIKFPDGKVGYVISNTPVGGQDVIVMKSVNGTNLTHTAGQKLSVFSNAFGEASTQPINRRFGQTQYTNKIQNFRDINSETDVQMASEVELEYNGSYYVIDRELAIKALMFKAWINGAIIGGSLSATSFQDANPALTDPLSGGAVQTTRGLDEYITTYGINDVANTPGQWNFADLSDVISQLLVAKTSKNYLILRGTKAAIVMDSYIKGINPGISSGRLSLDGKTFDYMVDGFKYGNFDFQFGTIGILDNQEFFSQTDIVRSIYFIPKDQVKTKGSGTLPRMMMRYMKHNIAAMEGAEMQNEYIAQWETGALARPRPTDGTAVRHTHWLSHQGLQILGAQHFAKSVVLAA